METEQKQKKVDGFLPADQPGMQVSYEDCLKTNIPIINKVGGMQFVSSLISNAKMMDPRSKANYNIFLNDSMFRDARKELLQTLDIWIDLLFQTESDAVVMAEDCRRQAENAQQLIAENLERIHETTRSLEISYRTIESFFVNTDKREVDFINTVNIDKKGLTDSNSPTFRFIQRKIVEGYDNLDLKKNYSLLVIPGLIDYNRTNKGWSVIVRSWAKMVHENKVLMVTDFEDCSSYNELLMRLDESNLQDVDNYLSSVVMTCTHILGRRKSDIADEYDDLYIPSSGALAGRMTDTEQIKISQGVVGQRYGSLHGVRSVRFSMLKSELSLLIDKGVIPMVELDGRVMSFSNRTLYIGPVLGLQEYPIVRVFDWVSKVIQNLCHEHVGRPWDTALKDELDETLRNFLEKYKGAGNLYEDFNLKEPQQDKDKNIEIKLELKPFFAAKNFLIELSGKKVSSNVEWHQKIHQTTK